jgi:hypothetical protein
MFYEFLPAFIDEFDRYIMFRPEIVDGWPRATL